MLTVHVVAHTHWDREWYHPFVRFRQRLVALIDELLADPPRTDESFLLDGQAIVVEDYLDLRPERTAELASLLQSGRLEAGPWYVLADELIPSGEALVRNLLLGRRVLRRLRASSPPVLYCPDSFGHPAALPAIAAGFGLPLIVLWRGYGGARWPRGDTVCWRAPAQSSVVLYHLPRSGYEYGSDLPVGERAAIERWRRIRHELSPRATAKVVLLPNGADHHARQQGQREAVEQLVAAAHATGDRARASSLSAFAGDLLASVERADLLEIRGELRDSYGYTWTLQGTFGTRAAQKRRNARAERALIRDAEPWAALARQRGAPSRLSLVVGAWRTLLQAHPHDTLCGCSIDAVAEAMDFRVEDALVQALGIRDDAIADIAGHDAVVARTASPDWRPVVLVRNRAPRSRGGVAIIEIEEFLADVPVGPGSAAAKVRRAVPPARPTLGGAGELQILSRRIGYGRTESPRHYPDQDLVSVTRAAVWIPAVGGYGISPFPLGKAASRPHERPRPVRVTETALDNGIVRVSVSPDGRVSIRLANSTRRLDDLLIIEDRADDGDLYTPAIRATASETVCVARTVTRRGPLLGEIRLRWRLRSPRAKHRRESGISIRIGLAADSPLLWLHVDGVNRHRNHRLRLGIRTDVASGAVWADAAFGPVQRAPLHVPNEDSHDELPPPTAPLHRYVSLFARGRGATLFSDGLAEYEATESGQLFVTLLRAVGQLSRNDLAERPGHAGWPAATPMAQSLGPFAARFALLLHPERSADTIDAIERAADDALLPLEGRTLRSALSIPAASVGVELEGAGLAFSTLKESENGEWSVVRCVNLLDEPVDGRWRFGAPVREAFLARLDETPLEPIQPAGNTIGFTAAPGAIVTILFR